MRRILIYDHLDAPIGELSPADVFSCVRREEVNGEHSLEVTTTRVLEKGWRILCKSDDGRWREYVVDGVDSLHESGASLVGTYYCTWSLQHDMQGVAVSLMPGVQSPVGAQLALEGVLDATARWGVGDVTVGGTAGASMYDMSAWQALGVLVDNWGGELDADIDASGTGITSRKVDLRAQLGNPEPLRRFDFGHDAKSVKRTLPDGPLYCRISPRGKGEQTDAGGYGRKITIKDVNGGKDYLEYAPMVDVAKLPDGSGGWEYPTLIVENPDCETPAELKAWGQSVLEECCTPKATYEVDVLQASAEGVDAHGVALGDAVHVVDRKFGPGGLRLSARVIAMTVDELGGSEVSVTLGSVHETLGSRLAGMSSRIGAAEAAALVAYDSSSYLLNNLLDVINAEICGTHGYTYLVPGEGIITYDSEVSDPLVGSEASAVVQVKGGSIRIANSKKTPFAGIGDWDFHNVMLADETVVAGATMQHLRTGFIGSPTGNYWNLDTGELSIFPTALAGGRTIQSIIDSADSVSGAANLLMDTDRPTLEKGAATADRYWCSADGISTTNRIMSLSDGEKPVGGVRYSPRFEIASGNAGKHTGICFYDNRTTRMVDGFDYTVSCWAKTNNGRAAELFFQYGQTDFVASERMELSGEWRRYSWTFEFDQERAGGSYGARMYFLCAPKTAYQTTVSMTGFKLEVGKKPTDWCESAEDVQHRVDAAIAEAKAYTNSVSESDRAFATSERAALDASLNQEKVFKRLMTKQDGSLAQGLVLDRNGNLYVNGTYIKANTLSGSSIYGGIVTDRAGKNRWNLNNGSLSTGSLSISSGSIDGSLTCTTSSYGYANRVSISGGKLRFHTSSRRYSGKSDRLMFEMFPQSDAMELRAPRGIYLDTDRLQVHRSNGAWGTGWSGTVKVVTSVKKSGSKIKVKTKNLIFVDGILVK